LLIEHLKAADKEIQGLMDDFYAIRMLKAKDSLERDRLANDYRVASQWLRILTELDNAR